MRHLNKLSFVHPKVGAPELAGIAVYLHSSMTTSQKHRNMLDTIIPAKCRITVPQERYLSIDAYVQSAEAFSRNMFRPVFLFDVFKKSILYESSHSSHLIADCAAVFAPSGEGMSFLAAEDMSQLGTILEKAYDLFLTFPYEERDKLIFTFSLRTFCNGREKIVHHRLSPLALTDDGDLWLVLCTMYFSARKSQGYYVMKLYNENEYMQYNLEKDRWYHKEGIVLSFEEKEILLLSSQGYTMKEIASTFKKSVDTIKMLKRAMFAKLGVNSITEAVFTSMNLDLL